MSYSATLKQIYESQSANKNDAVEICQTLLTFPSITPDDAGCQSWIMKALSDVGFRITKLPCNGVKNFIAEFGFSGPRFAFCGHTDVVPPGDVRRWNAPPFAGEIRDNVLIGRGVADMKGGIAAMLAAVFDFIKQHPKPSFQIQFLITSDEEGEAEFGSKEIVKYLQKNSVVPEYCIVGEPSSRKYSADAITIGRRGAISGRLKVLGKLGHVAYPNLARNAIHHANQILSKIADVAWDEGSTNFPGTSFQVTYINSGDFTDNLVPDHCEACFNFRYSHKYTDADIQKIVTNCAKEITNNFVLEWERPCAPYVTQHTGDMSLLFFVEKAILRETKKIPILTTAGGTSDGRFFSAMGAQVLELGLPNGTIHQINEQAKVKDIIALKNIYLNLLQELHSTFAGKDIA